MMPYGTVEDTFAVVRAQLAKGPFILGDRFTVADAVWGSALGWVTMFGLIPREGVVAAYLDRGEARPALARARARDAEFVERLKAGG